MNELGDITRILAKVREGDTAAFNQLFRIAYDELRRVAHNRLAGNAQSALNTTALVHEAYLKLAHDSEASWENRAHFFAVAAGAIRQVLVDEARRRSAAKRGGGLVHVAIGGDTAGTPVAIAAEPDRSAEILEINDALEKLGELSSRLARVVELRFFAGLSVEEAAAILDIDPRTVKRDWRKARAFLHRELAGQPNGPALAGDRDVAK
jgi:RNA polymerase sigma factor (TIGR02999 family)